MTKSLLQLKDERALLLSKAERLIEAAKVEKRKLNEVEDTEFKDITTQIGLLSNEITLEESRGIKPKEVIEVKQTNKFKMTNFSLLRAVEARSNGRNLDETSIKVIEAGKEEMRKSGLSYSGDIVLPLEFRGDILAGTANAGQEVVAEDKMGILAPLRNKLVLVKAGATLLSGLVGDVSIPTYSGSNVTWKGEVVSAADGAGTFDEVTLAPKRLTAYIDISKQFLAQDSAAAEAMLMQDIVNAIAGKLEATILGKEAGSATQPAGFFATAPTINGAASWADIVALESAIEGANADAENMKYITCPAAKGILKTTSKVAGQNGFILDGTEMNGYPVLVTNAVANGLQVGADEYGILFGNFNDLVIGQWGALDLIVDPYTVAKEGKVRIVINAYFDAKPRRAESFKTGSLK